MASGTGRPQGADSTERLARWLAQRFSRLDGREAWAPLALVSVAAAVAIVLFPNVAGALFHWPATVRVLAGIVAAVVAGCATYLGLRVIAAKEHEKQDHAGELERRHHGLVLEHERMRADLETAREIQRMFLPDARKRPFPQFLSFAHIFLPEMAVGGDFYDLKPLDDHRVGILLVDVSGHGMSAAFITGLVKTTFEFGYSPERTTDHFMAHLNNVLEKLTPTQSFAAVIFAAYDVRAHELRFTNAGHNPTPVVVRARGRQIVILEEPVGLLAGVNPDMAYVEGKLDLSPGDKFVLCTDGVTDTPNEAGDRFGLSRFYDCLRRYADRSALELRDGLMGEVAEHQGRAERADDQTLIIMEVLK